MKTRTMSNIFIATILICMFVAFFQCAQIGALSRDTMALREETIKTYAEVYSWNLPR